MEDKDGKSAYIVYKYVLDEEPNNIKAYIAMADLYGQINNFPEAEKYIDEAELWFSIMRLVEEAIGYHYEIGC